MLVALSAVSHVHGASKDKRGLCQVPGGDLHLHSQAERFTRRSWSSLGIEQPDTMLDKAITKSFNSMTETRLGFKAGSTSKLSFGAASCLLWCRSRTVLGVGSDAGPKDGWFAELLDVSAAPDLEVEVEATHLHGSDIPTSQLLLRWVERSR
eukprot:818184-Amphidinium_carterae.1